jgi:hypothetical protein
MYLAGNRQKEIGLWPGFLLWVSALSSGITLNVRDGWLRFFAISADQLRWINLSHEPEKVLDLKSGEQGLCRPESLVSPFDHPIT